ncbi:DUF5522 domain-containing protein [Spirosoma endophyticum]|nr:DUF5522 domain-containing protein [Spirosoma endophyticum]
MKDVDEVNSCFATNRRHGPFPLKNTVSSTDAQNPMPSSKQKKIPGLANDDYYYTPEGFVVFTATYHLKRGYCCRSGCRHCPYGFKKKEE